MTTAADATTVEHAEASRDTDRRDDPLPARHPINMNQAGISSADDSGVLRQDMKGANEPSLGIARRRLKGQLTGLTIAERRLTSAEVCLRWLLSCSSGFG